MHGIVKKLQELWLLSGQTGQAYSSMLNVYSSKVDRVMWARHALYTIVATAYL